MLTIVFFNHGFLVEREVVKALRSLPQSRLVVVDTVPVLSAQQAQYTTTLLTEQRCNILVTINDWGVDWTGILADFLERNAIIHVNWCVDDPFFLETIHNVALRARSNRFDFVSDRGYVPLLAARGIRSFFLPLASDPEVFVPYNPAPLLSYGISFVGNSYVSGTEDLLKDFAGFIEEHIVFVNECNNRYRADIHFPLEPALKEYCGCLQLPQGLTPARAAFLIKHFVGYLYRKSAVVNLLQRFDSFFVVGDQGWEGVVPQERLVRRIGYYLGLSETYQKTAVNLDINRVVIRDGFTQRVFDCLASASFIITSPKAVVHEFFETGGPRQEVAVFDNEESLFNQVDYFLKHEDERKAIALRGRQKVLAEHTYNHRIGTIFKILQQEIGKLK